MGVSVGDLDAVEADVQRAAVLSIQGLTENDSADLLPAPDAGPEGLLLRREQLGLLRDAIAELPERLRTVVEQYFFAQRKMLDIAEDLGVTESRVSQLRSEALAMLRDGLRSQDSDNGAAAANVDELASRKRRNARQAYSAAIAARSTLAGRLQATTLLGEARAVARPAGQLLTGS
jgi:RNA polymerase sigma factor for flagellar operon FliA